MSLFNAPKFRKPSFKLALIATLLALFVVMLGTYTRLLDVDFGCSDWPICHGQLSILSGSDQAEFADSYRTGYTLLQPELMHRYLAGALGFLIIALAVRSWRRRDDETYPFRLPTFILFLVVWQALFGMWTAKLALWPQVVTVHLVMGAITCSLLWLLTLRLDNKRWKIPEDTLAKLTRMKPWIVLGVVLIIIQIILGGWVSANNAASACPDFPRCQSQWWPEMDMKKGFNITESFGVEALSQTLESKARVAIHVVHRLGALVTTIYIVGLAVVLLFIKHNRTRRMSLILMATLGMHLYMVIKLSHLDQSVLMVMLHNFGSTLLLLTLVTLATKVWTAKKKYQRTIS